MKRSNERARPHGRPRIKAAASAAKRAALQARFLLRPGVLCAVGACAAQSSGSSQTTSDVDAPAGCEPGSQRSCDCEEGSGTSRCIDGRYASCECAASEDSDDDSGDGEDEASSDGDVRSAPPRPGVPACKAGYYAGGFSGKYRPGFVGLGILESGVEVEVAGAEGGTEPALRLTLEEDGEGVGEFVSYSVGNGCMSGVAISGATETPFVARITGSLDCATGEFDGFLDGYYTLVGVPGLEFLFTGPLRAQFDPEEARLDQGTWMIMEPAALTGGAAGGGEGVWSAAFTAAAPPDSGTDPCAQIPQNAADADAP